MRAAACSAPVRGHPPPRPSPAVSSTAVEPLGPAFLNALRQQLLDAGGVFLSIATTTAGLAEATASAQLSYEERCAAIAACDLGSFAADVFAERLAAAAETFVAQAGAVMPEETPLKALMRIGKQDRLPGEVDGAWVLDLADRAAVLRELLEQVSAELDRPGGGSKAPPLCRACAAMAHDMQDVVDVARHHWLASVEKTELHS